MITMEEFKQKCLQSVSKIVALSEEEAERLTIPKTQIVQVSDNLFIVVPPTHKYSRR